MRKSDVDDALRATRRVEGWLFPVDAYLIGFIDAIQKDSGIRGNLFEIGVHHGKSAILLARAAGPGEVLGVCDVFGDQAANVDHSGEGSRELFLRNMRALSGLAEERVRVHAMRSELLTPDDTTAQCRMFHIDGGHRPQDVVADLRVADAAVLPNGVVIVDDVFNPSWPGVSEGFYASKARFAPFLIGGNKVFLTRPESTGLYREQLASEKWQEAIGSGVYARETKEWLGVTVHVAGRTQWVELNPIAAAMQHLVRLRRRASRG